MKEFGSDFHFLPIQESRGRTVKDFFTDALYYACGRQPIIDLYKKNNWKRLWVPEYFCYEVLSSLKQNGVNWQSYRDYPLTNENETVCSLPFEEGDALLRMNYFGLRSKRSNHGIPVPVVEDHTHDLIGGWAIDSDADWCIASLRKTLPLAEGGMLWSPKGLKLQETPQVVSENTGLASSRWEAMRKKTRYLNGEIDDKSEFRSVFLSTEERFDALSVSSIDNETLDYLSRFDVEQWYRVKKDNRDVLVESCSSISTVLEPEDSDCNPFSMTLLFDSEALRNDFRKYLINSCVYPAILWNVPENASPEIIDFSKRMLSVHCDGRYNGKDMIQLRDIIANSRD